MKTNETKDAINPDDLTNQEGIPVESNEEVAPEASKPPVEPIVRKAKEIKDLMTTEQRDEEILPVVREILAILCTRKDLAIGSHKSISEESAAKYYAKLYIEIVIPTLKRHNIRTSDLPFLFSVMMQPVEFLRDITIASMDENRETADSKLWGVDFLNDIRVNKLDDVLQAPVKKLSTENQAKK